MRVGLFVTCLVDLMRPRIGFAALRLLQAAGADVVVPAAQTCCGQPAYNAGDRPATRDLALKLTREFADCDYIVAPSGSCAAMLRIHYPTLFKDVPDRWPEIADLARRTYELTDFLVNVAKFEPAGSYTGTLTYHDSCSGLRELDIKHQPRSLLRRMPTVKLVEMPEGETCCGFGGTFAVKYGEIATRMADNKCRNIEACGAHAVVAGDLGCLLNIEGRLRRRGNMHTRVLHIAEVLDSGGEDGACK